MKSMKQWSYFTIKNAPTVTRITQVFFGNGGIPPASAS